MRILHISALPIWPIDGKGGMPSLRETLRGHIDGGHEIVVVIPRYQVFDDAPKAVAVPRTEGFKVRLAPCRWAPSLIAVRRAARRLGGGKEPPYPLRWVLNVSMCCLMTISLLAAALALRLRRGMRFDLVYAHNQYAAPAGWILGKVFRAPNVTRLYGTFLADLMNRPLVALRYPVAAAGYLVPHSLLICANDGTQGDVVARKLGIDLDKFRFWQNGVDLPSHPPNSTRDGIVDRFPAAGLRKESHWILSCSRLAYWKRIDRIVRALAAAVQAGCDCQLLLAGTGPEEERLRSLVKELNVESRVAWLGAVDHDTIWEMMHAADVFMIANDVTNRCNPLFEAICAGLPVVSVNDPSTADLLESGVNALLAEKDDVEHLGTHLARLCSDASLMTTLRRAQFEKRSQFRSWRERMAEEARELELLVENQRQCRTIVHPA